MASFGNKSKEILSTVHPDLQRLFNEVVKGFDCSILCGRRLEKEQMEAYYSGRSKVKFPDSKHNSSPSLAVDVAPFPLDWNNTKQFIYFAGYVKGIAQNLGIKVIWGGDWNQNNDPSDETFFDLPHFELVIETKQPIKTGGKK